MLKSYTPEFKKKIVRLHEEEGRTYKSITAEYGVSKASISKWCSEFSKECQTSPQAKEDYGSMKENLRLKKENEELRKEIAFLKTSASHPRMALHSLRRKSVRGLPFHRPIPYGIRRPLAAGTAGALPKCLLQLPETPEV